MNKTNGKIAEKSRQKMIEALLKIMKIYDYREITVTQIVQEAGLSRNTYYRLFHDKDDILALLFEKLFQQFYARIQQKKIESFWQVMQTYFDFWSQHKSLLVVLEQNHLLQRVLDRSYDKSDQVFRFVHARDPVNQYSLPLTYLLAFSVGGMHNMLIKWVECGMEASPKELIQKLRSCLMYDGFSAS